MTGSPHRFAIAPYLWSALVALVGAFAILHLWHMRIGVPLYYSRGGDELMMLTLTKALLDGAWIATISHLGAPFTMSTGDFPLPNLLHVIALRIITLFVHHAPVALNLYFIAGFPLIALVSTYALRRLAISSGAAVAMSVVYALLPIRFMRNEAELFNTQYYLLPLLVLAVVWVLRGHTLFDTASRRPTRDGYIFLISLLAVSWDNEYSAAFGAMLLAFAAAASYARTRAWRGVIAALLGIVVIFVGVEFELLPSAIYQLHNGKNTAIAAVPPQESEIYALSLAQLVLPIQKHRIPSFSAARALFDSGLPQIINENSSATLGALGALGFLGTLAALLLVRVERARDLWPELARINLATFFLATIGGTGALLSYYFFPYLHFYYRISPLIGFVSLAAMALVLDTIRRRWLAGWNGVWAAGLALLIVFALFDQTSTSYVPPYAADLQAYGADGAFVTILESRLPPNSEAYQLPHVTFPSTAPVELLGPWDQTSLYLQSHSLHYSFGSTRGREDDAWQLAANALPLRSSLVQLVLAGFEALLVYSGGYADNGVAEVSALSSQLGTAPILRAQGTIAFFDLSKIQAQYIAGIGPEKATTVRAAILTGASDPAVVAAANTAGHLLDEVSTHTASAATIDISFASGCYAQEHDADRVWHWCGNGAVLAFRNQGRAQRVDLSYTLLTGAPARVMVTVNGKRTVFASSPQGKAIIETLLVPRGRTTMRLSTAAQPLRAPADIRRLVMQISNLRISSSSVH